MVKRILLFCCMALVGSSVMAAGGIRSGLSSVPTEPSLPLHQPLMINAPTFVSPSKAVPSPEPMPEPPVRDDGKRVLTRDEVAAREAAAQEQAQIQASLASEDKKRMTVQGTAFTAMAKTAHQAQQDHEQREKNERAIASADTTTSLPLTTGAPIRAVTAQPSTSSSSSTLATAAAVATIAAMPARAPVIVPRKEVITGRLVKRSFYKQNKKQNKKMSDSELDHAYVEYTIKDDNGMIRKLCMYEDIDYYEDINCVPPLCCKSSAVFKLKYRTFHPSQPCCMGSDDNLEKSINYNDLPIVITRTVTSVADVVRGGKVVEHRIPCEITVGDTRIGGKYTAWEVFGGKEFFARYGKKFDTTILRQENFLIAEGTYRYSRILPSNKRLSQAVYKMGYYMEHADRSKRGYILYVTELQQPKASTRGRSSIKITKERIDNINRVHLSSIESDSSKNIGTSYLYLLPFPQYGRYILVDSPTANPTMLFVAIDDEFVACGTATGDVKVTSWPLRRAEASMVTRTLQPIAERSHETSVMVPISRPGPSMSSRNLPPRQPIPSGDSVVRVDVRSGGHVNISGATGVSTSLSSDHPKIPRLDIAAALAVQTSRDETWLRVPRQAPTTVTPPPHRLPPIAHAEVSGPGATQPPLPITTGGTLTIGTPSSVVSAPSAHDVPMRNMLAADHNIRLGTPSDRKARLAAIIAPGAGHLRTENSRKLYI